MEYDVAISLLSVDLPFARRMERALRELVRGEIFLYTRRQEEIALDGSLVNLFTSVFRDESRIAVVLYRDGWGDQGYTAVEQEALKAKWLRLGSPRSIMIVSQDGGYPTTWYPASEFRFSAEQLSVPQIAAFVAGRVADLGGHVGVESAPQKAARLAAEARQREEIEIRLASVGPKQLEIEAHSFFDEMEKSARAIEKEAGETVTTGRGHYRDFWANLRWTSLHAHWFRERASNSLEDSGLRIKIQDQNYHPQGYARSEEPRTIFALHLELALDPSGIWGWIPVKKVSKDDGFRSTQELADSVSRTWVDLAWGDKTSPRRRPRPRGRNWATDW